MTEGWGFSRANRRGEWSGGDPTKYALDKEISVFTREVLQNANDQGPEDDGPVEVSFQLTPLTGSDLAEFKEAIDWDELYTHLDTVADMDKGHGYRRYLNRIEEEDELLLLTIEDRNTTGLIGSDDDESSNFRALVRDVLFSSKPDEGTSGGSYGLGKAVLWAFSGVSTVIFNSHLNEDPDDFNSPRLIARTRLPTHRSEDGDTIYQGPGWFGHFDEDDDEIPGPSGTARLRTWRTHSASAVRPSAGRAPPSSGSATRPPRNSRVSMTSRTTFSKPRSSTSGPPSTSATSKYPWKRLTASAKPISRRSPRSTPSSSASTNGSSTTTSLTLPATSPRRRSRSTSPTGTTVLRPRMVPSPSASDWPARTTTRNS
ncbi:hypothetical protein [Haloplanus litoreus]|uniref:Histidine kinase-, DNA gyrase B-, and HSP90-like ATPase n=1 Tax=Haloplanus litoreus TaxID=767515 RepID=A0ABD6A4I6_9EURY